MAGVPFPALPPPADVMVLNTESEPLAAAADGEELLPVPPAPTVIVYVVPDAIAKPVPVRNPPAPPPPPMLCPPPPPP